MTGYSGGIRRLVLKFDALTFDRFAVEQDWLNQPVLLPMFSLLG